MMAQVLRRLVGLYGVVTGSEEGVGEACLESLEDGWMDE
jgi:hypothetical protein